MKHLILFCALGLALFLVSCSGQDYRTIWSKPGASQEQYHRDKEACEDPEKLSATGGMGPEAQVEVCMNRKGWRKFEEPIHK